MNNRKSTNSRRVQVVLSKPKRIFVERYLTKKGLRLLLTKQLSKDETWKKYGKNRYEVNPEAVELKQVRHCGF